MFGMIMLNEYQQVIFEISERIVAAQKPIRVLDSIKWDAEIQANFFKSKFKKLTEIDAEYYQRKNPLQFDPFKKMQEFHDIERSIRRTLGQFSGVGSIMSRMCHEYTRVVELLLWRGTEKFTEISQELYGSSEDAFHIG